MVSTLGFLAGGGGLEAEEREATGPTASPYYESSPPGFLLSGSRADWNWVTLSLARHAQSNYKPLISVLTPDRNTEVYRGAET